MGLGPMLFARPYLRPSVKRSKWVIWETRNLDHPPPRTPKPLQTKRTVRGATHNLDVRHHALKRRELDIWWLRDALAQDNIVPIQAYTRDVCRSLAHCAPVHSRIVEEFASSETGTEYRPGALV